MIQSGIEPIDLHMEPGKALYTHANLVYKWMKLPSAIFNADFSQSSNLPSLQVLHKLSPNGVELYPSAANPHHSVFA